MKKKTISDDILFYILGRCIKQAILDYRYYSNLDKQKITNTAWLKQQQRRANIFLDSAKDYLFNPASLELQLENAKLNVNIDMIRLLAEPNINKWTYKENQ